VHNHVCCVAAGVWEVWKRRNGDEGRWSRPRNLLLYDLPPACKTWDLLGVYPFYGASIPVSYLSLPPYGFLNVYAFYGVFLFSLFFSLDLEVFL